MFASNWTKVRLSQLSTTKMDCFVPFEFHWCTSIFQTSVSHPNRKPIITFVHHSMTNIEIYKTFVCIVDFCWIVTWANNCNTNTHIHRNWETHDYRQYLADFPNYQEAYQSRDMIRRSTESNDITVSQTPDRTYTSITKCSHTHHACINTIGDYFHCNTPSSHSTKRGIIAFILSSLRVSAFNIKHGWLGNTPTDPGHWVSPLFNNSSCNCCFRTTLAVRIITKYICTSFQLRLIWTRPNTLAHVGINL